MNKQKEKVMKKLIYILFTSLYVAVTACSKIDYKINDAYETAVITGITLYAVSDKPVNIIESFEIDKCIGICIRTRRNRSDSFEISINHIYRSFSHSGNKWFY